MAGYIRAEIDAGAFPRQSRLPGEPELSRQLGVARGTARKALAVDLTCERLFDVIERVFATRITNSESVFTAKAVSHRLARLLGVPVRGPLL